MIGPSDVLNGKILIVDDKEANIILLERLLRDVILILIYQALNLAPSSQPLCQFRIRLAG